MTQNTSSAVMAQRAEPNDSLDFFPTPLWSTRALCEHVIDIRGKIVWEPACGERHMLRALEQYAKTVFWSDVHDYGGNVVHDFLMHYTPNWLQPDWVITNPPYRLGLEFIERGLDIASIGVAVLVRTSFIESANRYEMLFKFRPPAIMAQFVERVAMYKGRVQRGSTATAYCWLVWYRKPPAWDGCRLQWIPPCKRQLEREGDWA